MSRVTVVGAGNGGLAAVADLATRGHAVRLWNRGEGALAAIARSRAVRYEGVLGTGAAPVEMVTTDLGAAVDGVDAILVCLPAPAHRDVAERLAAHLRAEQVLILNPGGLLGSVAVAGALRSAGYQAPLRIAETATLTYICRKTAPDAVRVTSVATDLPFAALPGEGTVALVEELAGVLPNIRPVEHILAAGIASINTVLHPPGMILGAAWIEHTGGDFAYYADTAVPSVARLLGRLDDERLAVARAWHITAEPFLEVFARIGSTSAEAASAGDFLRALQDSTPNRAIRAPESLDTRYLNEDIPFGVVPLADLARAAEVATPVLEAVITIASAITGRDYRALGRTLASVGLGGLSAAQVLDRLEHAAA